MTCGTGIDKSSMSVTFSLVNHLAEHYNTDAKSASTILHSLREGVLLGRAGKKRSFAHYTFPGQMLPEYQPK